ncbi:MAG: twin-arginine translocase TatA/TatE family subunit [Acidobacteria bacterium]|nr:twin-arginine translocase TatA/TatE family subunit [Acidobacteriota bacterium]
MGLGTELLFIFVLAVVLLGPKRLPEILGRIARAKGHLEKITYSIKSQLEAEIEGKDSNDVRQQAAAKE